MPLEGERITIGRHPEVDIVIENPSVSRHHAELIAKGGG
ncbi:MAG: FHA domain-containing protein, partial [Deltaproteobacteria bacterium]